MNLRIAARLAARELRGGLAGFRILLACIILGVAAIAAVGTIRASIEGGLAEKGALLLGGDAEIGLTYRFANEEERAWMAARSDAVSEIVDFRSLAVTAGGDRALTQVKAVDDAYPLIGGVVLDPAMPLAAALDGREGVPGAVMAPALIARLGLAVGDVFRLGGQDFVLAAALEDEPDGAAAGFALGPRTLVRTAALQSSGLLQAGTLFSTRYRLALPEGADLAALERSAQDSLGTSGIEWRDARNGAPGIATFVDRLGAFLVLVGLSGLAVGGVGISAALRAHLARKTGTIAILRTLGADRGTILATYFLQIGALALLGLILGTTLGAGIPVLLAPVIEARLPVPAAFAFYGRPMAEAVIYGALAVLIFTLAPLSRVQDIRAASLFRDGGADARKLPRWPALAIIALLLAALLGAAAWFSGNLRLTLWTAGGIIGALAFLALAAALVRAAARLARPWARGRPALHWALAAIGGPRSTAVPAMLSLGLGLTVLAAVGQIDGTLRGSISNDLPGRAPSFFFIDLQPDQLPDFLEMTQGDAAVSRVDSAPMLRGMITAINGQDPADVAGDHWVLNGDRGITYAASANGPLDAGEWWPADYDGPPQISFASEEAAEIGIGLGDAITVNILGRDITATVTSLREVDFSTAGIGFIMVMNPSALAGAPHSAIATVYADEDAEARILREVSDSWPNVTGISVRSAIDRVADLLAGLAAATSWGASATLLTGLLVLIGAAAADQNARIFEAAVLKTLGATRGRILASLAIRAVLLGAAAGAVAIAAGALGGWAVSHYVLEVRYAVLWPSALLIVAAGVTVTLLTALVFAWRPLSARPAQVLRARE
ncbi:drug:proton antiporter [Pelagivirga sediminicola]|uniref:Drug:proton antiporter n=1 Tax=Pelagivirga sediminicola TaxID=2170575 RepID=A0A2T7G687_9RHOB|nr:FtsX-like permease family protein [Pelagivirga sediminicola]PVA09923.1 drug:proton antiporter [Pelagivirga sediminicola]